MTCYQKLIREQEALVPDPLLEEKTRLAQSFKNATVREVPKTVAKPLIDRYEWLARKDRRKAMGTTDISFGLYFGEYLAGVVCFGRTAGTQTFGSVCGIEYAHRAKALVRGACEHWAHPHSASCLISRACHLMAEKGFHIFVAYSDAEADEIGTVYQACNWNYCGTTKSGSSLFVWPKKPVANDRDFGKFMDGKERDERAIQGLCRDRSAASGGYRVKCTRHEMHEKMQRAGFVFFKATPKRRYVGFYGTRDELKVLRAALKWETFPYPKRLQEAAPGTAPVPESPKASQV